MNNTDNKQIILFDIIYTQDGRTVGEAIDYFNKVAPILQKHGLVRLGTYPIMKTIRGDISQPALINLWRMDKEDAMQKMGSDLEYQKMAPTRDALFDMSKISVIMGENI